MKAYRAGEALGASIERLILIDGARCATSDNRKLNTVSEFTLFLFSIDRGHGRAEGTSGTDDAVALCGIRSVTSGAV